MDAAESFRNERADGGFVSPVNETPDLKPFTRNPSLVAANNNETPDFVTVIRPWDRRAGCHSTAHCGKQLTRNPDGTIDSQKFLMAFLFTGATIEVGDIRELAALLAETADRNAGFIIRGALADTQEDAVFARRKLDHGDGVPVGILDAHHRWLPIDFDDVPNPSGLDPRRQPDATLDWILTLLPPALSRASVAWDWSSRMCINLADDAPPPTLNVHVWAWLDTGLDEAETRELLKFLRQYASDRLAQQGVAMPSRKGVDSKLADIQQPISVAAPLLIGLSDPFPAETRRGLREGTSDVVCLAALRAELEPTCSKMPATRRRREAVRL